MVPSSIATGRSGLTFRPAGFGRLLNRGLVVLGLATLFVFAFLTAIRLAYAILYVAVMLIAASWIWARHGAKGLELRRNPPEGAYQVGEELTERIEIENKSILGMPWVEVLDGSGIPGYSTGRPISLGAKTVRRWQTRGRFIARGRYRTGPMRVVTGDPFGLFQRVREIPATSTVIVYPRLIDVGFLVTGSAESAGDRVAVGRQMDTPPDAFGIREYDPDDGVNRIHWPSTARLGRPMSRSFEKYEGDDLLIVLDLGRGVHRGEGQASSMEYAVSLAASVAMAGLSRGEAVGLICSDLASTMVTSGRGAGHMRKILEVLALAEADGEAPFRGAVERALAAHGEHKLFVITPRVDDAWVDLISSGKRGRLRSTVIHLGGRGGQNGSQRPHARGKWVRWWEIGLDDEIFATTARPGVVALAWERPPGSATAPR